MHVKIKRKDFGKVKQNVSRVGNELIVIDCAGPAVYLLMNMQEETTQMVGELFAAAWGGFSEQGAYFRLVKVSMS